MPMYEWIGMVAGFATTIAFVPQVIRVWRTHNTRDLSLPMYLCLDAGLLLWLVYGCYIASWPVIIYNAITFVLSSAILVAKWRFG
ncbi:SemiSWEET transporter [Burkholderiaceae bacterium DAT-1]|nr:SemiSWEET transporter [Burkholderiaceae bacterium DAT-1]